jgi:hypothetical protein
MKGARKDIPDFRGRLPKDLLSINSSEDIIADTVKFSLSH